MTMLRIISDLHIGVMRASGTTPATQLALRSYIIDRFQLLLPDSDLMILGDLFDKENIPISDVLRTYEILLDWLFKGHKLYLVAGNHDLSKTSSVLSSFDFLCGLLTKLFPQQVVVITKQGQMTPYGYVIPHVANQDLFNLELAKVPQCDYLFLHCNYDNGFASQLDQSLNLSEQQAKDAPANHIIIAHEHYHRTIAKVTLPGNQISSSCADWASKQDKFYTELGGSDSPLLITCSERSREYVEVSWRNVQLSEVDVFPFVKLVGTATSEEASNVVTQIAKIRQAAKALVVTNGVTIQSDEVDATFSESMETLKAFSVWESLKKILTPEEITKLEGIMHD